MKLTKLLITIIILLILHTACEDNSNPLVPETELTMEQFPNEIGTVWIYQRYDSLNQDYDTLQVSITDTTKITDDSLFATVWIYSFEDSTDTLYYTTIGDTAYYYQRQLDSLSKVQKIVFPLEKGAGWGNRSMLADTNEVVEVTAISTISGRYNSGFHLDRFMGGLNEYSHFDYWFVPDIGLVYLSKRHMLWALDVNVTWNLISFIKPDSLTIDEFPMQVGARWEYYVLDSLIDCAFITDCIDSAVVSILDSVPTMIEDVNENWLFEFRGENRIFQQTIRIDEAAINWYTYLVSFSLKFPMKVGDRWANYFPWSMHNNDSIFVLDRRSITTPAGNFNNAYYLEGTASGFEEFSRFHLWIVPDIGIVKIDFSGFTIGYEEKQSWFLKTYDPDSPLGEYTVDQFPNYDGISWMYEIIDIVNDISDTVHVHVNETGLVAVWRYDYGDSMRTELVGISGDTVTFAYTDPISYVYRSLVFPISVGSSWGTFPLGDSSTVTSILNFWTPAGTFFPTYSIKTIFDCGDECSHIESYQYTPDVGMLFKAVIVVELDTVSHTGVVIRDERWRLLDYSFRN